MNHILKTRNLHINENRRHMVGYPLPQPTFLFQMSFNIILSHTQRSLKRPSSFRFPSKPCTRHIPYPSHPRWFDRPNNIWWAVQIRKLLIMQFSSDTCYALNLCSSLIVRDQVSHTYRITSKILVLYVLSSCFQICITQGGKRLCTQRRQGLPKFIFFRHAILIY
jgi:hypothetical protein